MNLLSPAARLARRRTTGSVMTLNGHGFARHLHRHTGRDRSPAARAVTERLAQEEAEDYPAGEGILEDKASDKRYAGKDLRAARRRGKA